MFQVLCIFFFIAYVIMRFTVGITRSSSCLIGKTAIVTGANSGLGYYTVLSLASRGCKVIMADIADMENSKHNIMKFTSNNNIITYKLDLSSLHSVREFASHILKKESRLHILINNAGISASKINRTMDGLHPVMQVNYFGHFLLTHLLIVYYWYMQLDMHPRFSYITLFIKPNAERMSACLKHERLVFTHRVFLDRRQSRYLLKKSAPSRIVFTSSFMSFYNNLSLETLNFDDKDPSFFSSLRIYCNSKYAMLLASDMFAKKLERSGVTSNSVNPGFMTTPMISNFLTITHSIALLKFLMSLLCRVFSKSAWEGAQVLTHVAVSNKLQETTGKHFWDCKPFLKPLGAYNEKFCKEIWDATEKYVKLAPDERL